MAQWKAYRIKDVISEIEDTKFVLPVIQRRLVWDEEKIELLFDTVLKGDAFGGIIVIEEEKGSKPLFNFRPFTKDGNPTKSMNVDELSQVQNFVIDGQQRLQSFYIGLKGTINGKTLFFDLFSNHNSFFEFKFDNDIKNLPKAAKDVSERVIAEHCWYLAPALLNRLKETDDEDQVAEEIIARKNIQDETKKALITKNIKAFYKNIVTSETLGISKVNINKSFDALSNRQRIVELFKRLNDGGTKLSPFDLVASILKGYDWKMEAFLDEILAEYSDLGLNQDILIKLIFLLQDNHKKEMTEIEAADAEFAVEKKERIKNSLEAVRFFLKAAGLYNYFKDGNRSFIPLYFVAYHVFHKNISDNDVKNFFTNHESNSEYDRVKKWIYYSLLNGVFSRGVGWIPYKTGIRKILEEIKEHKGQDFPTEELFSVYFGHGLNFASVFTTTNIDYMDHTIMYYLIYDRNQTIRIQDIDHIMPYSLLVDMKKEDDEQKYEYAKINNIKNYQLLDYSTNRGDKNGKPFREWVSTYIPNVDSYIALHLIPADKNLWDEERFEEFTEARGQLILDKIRMFIG